MAKLRLVPNNLKGKRLADQKKFAQHDELDMVSDVDSFMDDVHDSGQDAVQNSQAKNTTQNADISGFVRIADYLKDHRRPRGDVSWSVRSVALRAYQAQKK